MILLLLLFFVPSPQIVGERESKHTHALEEKKKLWVQGLYSETEDDRCRPRSLLNDSNDHFSVKWWWSNEGNHVFGSTIRGFFLRISLGIYRPGRLSHSEFRFRVPVPLRFGMANTKEKKSCGFSGCVRRATCSVGSRSVFGYLTL